MGSRFWRFGATTRGLVLSSHSFGSARWKASLCVEIAPFEVPQSDRPFITTELWQRETSPLGDERMWLFFKEAESLDERRLPAVGDRFNRTGAGPA